MHADGRTYWAMVMVVQQVFWRACTGNVSGKLTVWMRRRVYTIRKLNVWKIKHSRWKNWHLHNVYSLSVCSDCNYTGEMDLRARSLYTEKFPKFPRYPPERTARFRNTFTLNVHFVLSFHLLLVRATLSDFLLQALWSSSTFNFRPNKVNLQVVYWFCFQFRPYNQEPYLYYLQRSGHKAQ
jgi:hypothetical protein